MAERGKTGERGLRGDRGVRGDAGDEGRAGVPGVVGRTGPTGKVILPRKLVWYLVSAPVVLAAVLATSFVLFSDAVTSAQREGCERVNNLREVVAATLQDNIDAADEQLAKPLAALEPLRGAIKRSRDQRAGRLVSLRRVAAEHPVEGKPYRVDCKAAYP